MSPLLFKEGLDRIATAILDGVVLHLDEEGLDRIAITDEVVRRRSIRTTPALRATPPCQGGESQDNPLLSEEGLDGIATAILDGVVLPLLSEEGLDVIATAITDGVVPNNTRHVKHATCERA